MVLSIQLRMSVGLEIIFEYSNFDLEELMRYFISDRVPQVLYLS